MILMMDHHSNNFFCFVPQMNILEIAYLHICTQEEMHIGQYRVDHSNNTQFVQENARSCSYSTIHMEKPMSRYVLKDY